MRCSALSWPGWLCPANLSFRRVMTEKIEDVAISAFSASVFRLYGFAYGDRPAEYALTCGASARCSSSMSIAGKIDRRHVLGPVGRRVVEGQPVDRRADEYARTDGTHRARTSVTRWGSFPSSLFVIFVIMALFTTFMATPLLSLIEKLVGSQVAQARRPTPQPASAYPDFVRQSRERPAVPEIGATCCTVVCSNDAKVTADPLYDRHRDQPAQCRATIRKSSFQPRCEPEAERLGLRVDMRYRVTDHYTEDLCALAMTTNITISC